MTDMDDRLRDAEIKLSLASQRIEDHATALRTFASMSTQVSEINWRLEDVRADIDQAHGSIRNLEQEIELVRREVKESRAERMDQIQAVELQHRAELMKLQERQDAARLENRRLLFGLIGIFLTSAAAVLAPILSGGSP